MDPNSSSSSSSSSSCVVSYLMISCGLTEKQALSASKKLVNFKTASNPDTVLTFFQDYGFTKTDISKIISKLPLLLLSDAHKSFKPKLDFFISKDISRPDVINCITTNPRLLKRSVKNHIIPYFDFIKSVVGTDKFVFAVIRRSWFPPESIEKAKLNIQVLRDEGIPQSNIVKLLINQPRKFIIDIDRFKQVVQEVKSMGFDDPHKYAFIRAIHSITSMTKSNWETKLNVYRKCGWSEEQIQHAFKIHPICMTLSEKKILKTMDYLVNQMGFSSSLMARHPTVLTYSLEKRIIPRCSVYRSLVSKGLIKVQISISCFLAMSDESFLDKYVVKYEEGAPELMKIYKEAFNGHVMDEGVQGCAVKNEKGDMSEEEEAIDAVPLNEKSLDDSQASVLQKKVGLDEVEESKKVKRPTEVMKKSKKKKVIKKVKKKVEELENVKVSAKKKEEEVMAVVCAVKEEEEDFLNEKQEIAAVPMDAEVLEDSQASLHKKKVGLDKVEESKKDKKPKKVSEKSKTKVEEVQSSVAKKEEDIVDTHVVEKVVEDKVKIKKRQVSAKKEEAEKSKKEEVMAVLQPHGHQQNLKKEVEEVQGSAKKEKEDKAKEEEIAAVSMVGKVLEVTQSSVVKRTVVLDKEEEPKKSKRPKKFLKKSSKKLEEVQISAAIKYDVVQKSISRVMVDSQSEEVAFCTERDVESVPALPKVAKVVDKNQAGKPKKKASSSDLVEQEKELKKKDESKKSKKPKKVLKKSKKKVKAVQGSTAKKKEEDKVKEEEEIVSVPIVEKILEDRHANVIKRKLVLDTMEDLKIVKRPEKLSKKSKKKVEEKQCSGAKNGDHDKSEEEVEVAVVSMVEKVLEDSQTSTLKSKVAIIEARESKKAKKIKKVLKKPKNKAEEVQASAAIKYDVEVPELLQASNRPVPEDSQNEEVTFCPERATESVAALPKLEKVVNNSEVGEPKKKASLTDLVELEKKLEEESKKVRTPKKILIKSKKTVEVVQGSVLKRKEVLDKVEELRKAKRPKKVLKESKEKLEQTQDICSKAAIKYDVEAPQLLQASNSRVKEDSQSEESVAALPKVAKVVDISQVSKPKTKSSLSDFVEPKKVMKKFKKKVKVVPSSPAKEEEEIVAVSIVEKILEDSHSSVLKRKLVLDSVEKSKKVKRAKKLLKKSKKKVEEKQYSGAKKEEHDKSKEEDEVAAVSMFEKELEDGQASVLKSKVDLEGLKKVKKYKKVFKKPKRKAEEVQGNAAI